MLACNARTLAAAQRNADKKGITNRMDQGDKAARVWLLLVISQCRAVVVSLAIATKMSGITKMGHF
jgi:hypothetical protein